MKTMMIETVDVQYYFIEYWYFIVPIMFIHTFIIIAWIMPKFK